MVRVQQRLLLVVPCLVALLVAAPSMGGLWIRDDVLYVVKNADVTEPVSVADLFGTPFCPSQELGLYRPVTTATFRLAFIVGERLSQGSAPDPWVFHAFNLALSALAVLLVGLLARRLDLNPQTAAVAALVMAGHAARSESVCWISGSSEGLMTLFALATLWSATLGSSAGHLVLTGLLGLLSFFSKEQGVVLVLLVPCLPRLPRKSRWRHGIFLALVLGLGLLWRRHILGGVGPTGLQQVLHGFSAFERIPLAVECLGRYLRLCLWPSPLCNEYDDPLGPPASVDPVHATLTAAATTALVLCAWKQHSRTAFALLLMLLPLAPVMNVLVRTGEVFAERFLALPIAGLALLGGLLGQRLPRLTMPLVLVAATVWAVLFWQRAQDWGTDELTFFQRQTEVLPDMGSGYALRARARLALDTRRDTPEEKSQRDRLLLALEDAERARSLAPHQETYHLEALKFLLDLAKHVGAGAPKEEEIRDRSAAIADALAEKFPHIHEVHSLRAQTLELRGRSEEALEAWQRALLLEPRSASAAFALATRYRAAGRSDEALHTLQAFNDVLRVSAHERPWDPQPHQVRAKIALLSAELFMAANNRTRALAHWSTAKDLALGARPLARTAEAKESLLRDACAALDRLTSVQGARKWGEERRALLRSARGELESWTQELRPQCEVFTALSRVAELEQRQDEQIRWLERARDTARLPNQRARLEAELRTLRGSRDR